MSFVLYNASAGSGKTYTLVRDYLKIALQDPQHYTSILAVTFTNKAAGEMKERIIATLGILSNPPVPDKHTSMQAELCAALKVSEAVLKERAQNVLTAILHGYSDFAVSTIDSFVMKIIRTFSRELGLPLQFEVDMMPRALLAKTIDMLLSRAGTAGAEDITNVITTFIEQQLEDEAGWDITPLVQKTGMSLFDDDAHARSSTFTVDDIARLWGVVNQFRGDMKKKGERFTALYTAKGLSVTDFSFGATGVAGYFLKIQGAHDAMETNDIMKLKPGVRVEPESGKSVSWYTKGSTEKERIDPIIAELDAVRCDTINYFSTHVQCALGAEALLKHIYGVMLLNYLASEIEQFKRQNQVIPISDFGRLVNAIVKDNPVPFIYLRIGEKYSHIFIDEFQDTSKRQWENFLPLVGECISKTGSGLAVGDGKQAIYRFRGGDVSLIRQNAVCDIHAVSGQDADCKNLGSNFRSSPVIVDFNNTFFNAAFKKLPLAHQEMTDIYSSLTQLASQHEDGYVQIDAWNTDDVTGPAITAHITKLLSQNFAYGDIAVLVRNNKTGAAITEYLFTENIPVVSPEFLLLAREPSVLFVINALRYASDAKNTAAFMQMMHFYLPKVTKDSDMIFTDIVKNASVGNYVSPEAFQETLPEIYKKCTELHYIKNMPVYEAAEMIIRVFALHSLENGAFQGYLASLLNHMLGYIQDSCADSAGFLRWWDENKETLYMPVTEGIDAVSVLTVHKSKGAEYPAVILAESWALGFGKFPPQVWVKANKVLSGKNDESLITLSKDVDKSVYADEYNEELKKNYLDNLNLLYVAFTRAMRALIVLVDEKDSAEFSKTSEITKTSHLIIACCNEIPSTANSTGNMKFAYGKELKVKQKPKEDNLILPSFISEEWRSRVSIRRRAHQLWLLEDSEKAERVNHGIILHDILSRVCTADDVADAIRYAVYEGTIDEDEHETYYNNITAMINANEHIQGWFSSEAETERDIAIQGQIIRPDRVVFQNDGAIVIDYKTGMYEEKKHKDYLKQVQAYMQALKAVGYTSVSGFIWYIEDKPAEPFSVAEGA